MTRRTIYAVIIDCPEPSSQVAAEIAEAAARIMGDYTGGSRDAHLITLAVPDTSSGLRPRLRMEGRDG